MKLSEMMQVLEATILAGEGNLEREFTRCGGADLMSDVLIRPTEGAVLLTGLTSVQTLRTAQIAGVLAIVYVRGKRPAPEVIDLAKEGQFTLFSSPYSMFVSCGRLHALGLRGLDGRR